MTPNSNTPPHIFVINMPHCIERRNATSARLNLLGLAHTFFSAIDGSQLDLEASPYYAKLKRHLFFGRDLTKAEYACFLSHRALYQHILDKNIPAALILEDDATFASDLPEVINALMNSPIKWDLIRFLHHEKTLKRSRFVAPLIGPYALTRIFGAPGGAHGYLLNQHAARQLLKHTQKIWLPIDTVHGYVWNTRLQVFGVMPSPIQTDDNMPSTIGDVRFNKTVTTLGWKKLVYPMTRFVFKLYEAFNKYLSFYSLFLKDKLQKSFGHDTQ